MPSATLIFPHQLFESNPALQPGTPVYLLEEFLFFRQYNFHKQKLVLHRAGMKFYESFLMQNGYKVYYIETNAKENDCRVLIDNLSAKGIADLHITDPVDDWLLRRLKNKCIRYNIQLHLYRTPCFLNSMEEVNVFFDEKKRYFQTDFYTWQRKQRKVLLEKDNQPLGGRWSFDADNRKKFPKNERVPVITFLPDNEFIVEARRYIEKNFPGNYGSVHTQSFFCVTHEDAAAWLSVFLHDRFEKFGVYEDAIVSAEHILYHSVLTPMLNVGLLTPKQILHEALLIAREKNIPLNSTEGFVRQVMGWREFIRIVYEREGRKQRTKNYWKFNRKIPAAFWTGETGVLPIDITIKKVLRAGYCHHIERLMVLGNFMLLCEFDPDEVYRWFMQLFIDAYDRVMVPNVYGMTQFADGGLMTTKPYISGSNYLMKMSDYKKGEWQDIWDGLFWRFMSVHRHFFIQNPRWEMLVKSWDKMDEGKRNKHLTIAEEYLRLL